MRGGRHPTFAIQHPPLTPPPSTSAIIHHSSLHHTHITGIRRNLASSFSNTPSGSCPKKGTHLLEFIFEFSYRCSTPKNTQLPPSAKRVVSSWDCVRIIVSYLRLWKSQQSGRGGLITIRDHACTITNTKLSSQNNNRDRLDNSAEEIHSSNVCFPTLNVAAYSTLHDTDWHNF